MSIVGYEIEAKLPSSDSKSLSLPAIIMCILGAVFYCYEYYLRVAPSVIQPQLMQAFNLSQAGLGGLVAYYYLAYVPLQIPVGLMMDYWGPRRVLTVACLACALGSYLFGTTDINVVAKLGRFLVGFGSAFAYVGVLKIANLWLPKRYFATIAGLCSALGMLGAMSSGVLMTMFVELIDWQQAFVISAFVGLILALVLLMIIRDKSDKHVMQLGRDSHAGKSLAAELLEVVRQPQLWINGVIGCLSFLPLTAFAEFWAVSYLQSLGLAKEQAAMGAGIVFLGYAVGAPIWGYISELMSSRRTPMMIGTGTAGACAIIFLGLSGNSLALLWICMFVMGLFASVQILIFAVGTDLSKPELSATTVSFTNFLVMIGGIILQPMVGLLLDILEKSSIDPYGLVSIDTFRIALLILPLGLIVACALCFILRESYPASSSV